jgi:carboxylesterase type B
MSGSASLEVYNPEAIVNRGNVIFVAMQYRVGAHGFLYFGQESNAPGNVGLLDQVST